jgi:hypothetical protein
VRDTITRQSDVDASSVKYDIESGTGKYRNGTITFAAKKGKSIDLEKIHESLKGTRLSGKTRSAVNYLEITADGSVVQMGAGILLKVSGTPQQFRLADDPKAKSQEGTKTPLQRLRATVEKGEKVVSVTGRVAGWNGPWPMVLRNVPGKPAKEETGAGKAAGQAMPLLLVTDFKTMKD